MKMKRHTILPYLFILVFIISSVSIDYSVATSRKDLLEQFCINNQTGTGGFIDYNNGTEETITEFTSLANLFILYEIDPTLEKIDKKKAEFWFIDRLSSFTSTVIVFEPLQTIVVGCKSNFSNTTPWSFFSTLTSTVVL